MEQQAAALKGGHEAIHPLLQLLAQVKLREHELHLAILHLAQIEDFRDEPQQHTHVAPRQLEERALLVVERRVVEQAVDGVDDEREGCAKLVAQVGEKLQSGLCRCFHETVLHRDVAVQPEEYAQNQEEDDDDEREVDLLVLILREIGVHPTAQHGELCTLLPELFVLHEEERRVLLRHEGRLQVVVAGVGLALQDVHGEPHHQVAASGIDVGSAQSAVAHQFQSAARHRERVDAHIDDVVPASGRLHCLACSDGHAVVLSHDGVKVGQCGEQFCHLRLRRPFQPVGVAAPHHLYLGIGFERFHHAAMALDGGRRPFQPHHLHHLAAPAELQRQIAPHGAPDFVVVSADEGGVLL